MKVWLRDKNRSPPAGTIRQRKNDAIIDIGRISIWPSQRPLVVREYELVRVQCQYCQELEEAKTRMDNIYQAGLTSQ